MSAGLASGRVQHVPPWIKTPNAQKSASPRPQVMSNVRSIIEQGAIAGPRDRTDRLPHGALPHLCMLVDVNVARIRR